MTDLAALVAVANVRGNASMTETGTETETGIERETTEMTGTEGEGVAPQFSKGGVLPALTGGRPKSVSMTVRGPHPLLTI